MPSRRPLERLAFLAGEVVGLGLQVLGRQVRPQHGPDLSRLGQVGEQTEQPHEHPVAVHRRVPVVRSVERRVEGLRALHVGRPGHDVLGLVRVLLAQSLEGQPGECRCLLPGQDGRRLARVTWLVT